MLYTVYCYSYTAQIIKLLETRIQSSFLATKREHHDDFYMGQFTGLFNCGKFTKV